MKSTAPARYTVTIDDETASIGTAGELAAALDVLQGQHDRQILEQLRPQLPEIVGSPLGLLGILRSLSPEDQTYLVEALAPRLVGLIGNATHLRNILAVLSEQAVEHRLLLTLGPDGLRRLILDADELAEVLQWIYGDCDRLVLDLLGVEYVGRLIATSRDLSRILPCVDETTQAWLLETLGWPRVTELATDGRALAALLRALPAGLGGELLGDFSPPRLAALIGNERDWDYLCRRVEPAEAAALYRQLGVENHA